MKSKPTDLAPAGQRGEAEDVSVLAGPIERGGARPIGHSISPMSVEGSASRSPSTEEEITRRVAQAVGAWYEQWRANDIHPFTIPQEGVRALVRAVCQEISKTG